MTSGMKVYWKNAVIILVGINILAFIAQLLLGDSFTNALLLDSSVVWQEPWRLVTSMFLHANFSHILFNMYVLLIFGPLLEQRIGTKRFMTIYMVSGLAAALLSTFFYDRALGASGAIMGIMAALAVVLPRLQVLFFFFVPMPLWLSTIVVAALDMLGIFVPDGTAHIAHLAGLAAGLAYGFYYKSHSIKFKRRFAERSHIDEEDFDEYLRSGRI